MLATSRGICFSLGDFVITFNENRVKRGVSFKYFLRISTTCLLGIILVGSEIRRDLSLGETSVGLGETLTCLGETLHGRNSLWAKTVVTSPGLIKSDFMSSAI